MTRTILVAGTASHVGKSTIAAGLCRLLARRGVSVAPFKAQNMSNNARAVVNPDGGRDPEGEQDPEGEWERDGRWGEIGVSQYVQAEAAGVAPTTDHNPVLLKPRGDGESQLVIDGDPVGHFAAGSYYDDHWDRALTAAREAHERLASRHDVVVAEGAGSIAELNLHHRDLANVETARFADRVASPTRPDDRATESRGVDILLVGDVERGGVFASLYGTLELMPDDLRERVAGVVVNKFRGDRDLLEPGLADLEARTGVPVLGVLPYDDPGLPAEDSVSLPPPGETEVRGDDDGVPDDEAVTVAVPRLPRVSNVTDLEPLAREPGVRVRYQPLDADLGDADAVVLPGTKNTVDDLLALRDAGFGARLAAFDGPVVGLCGGYQMLGERVTNAAVEGTGDRETVTGFGLLPVETRFSPDKRVERVERELTGAGPLGGATGTVSGYEIHAGETTPTAPVTRPFAGEGVATDRVLGTYLHGLFENEIAREGFLAAVFESAGRTRRRLADGASALGPNDASARDTNDASARSSYDAAADLLADHLDLATLIPSG